MAGTLIQWIFAHPLSMGLILATILPVLPLALFRKSFRRGPLPHEVAGGLASAVSAMIPATGAFKAGRKRIQFSDARIQRDHESKLVRLLEATQKQGPVAPSEETAGVKV